MQSSLESFHVQALPSLGKAWNHDPLTAMFCFCHRSLAARAAMQLLFFSPILRPGRQWAVTSSDYTLSSKSRCALGEGHRELGWSFSRQAGPLLLLTHAVECLCQVLHYCRPASGISRLPTVFLGPTHNSVSATVGSNMQDGCSQKSAGNEEGGC